jgi:diguanylate cyclase (GGDEF)-like protein/PAS domain S-box-containing protein
MNTPLEALTHELLSLRSVVNTVGSYIFTKDMDGRYTFANELACQLFGVPVEQVVGRDDRDFFDLDTSNDLRKHDLSVLEQGITIQQEERNIIKSTGEERTYWAVKTPVRNAQGLIIGMCGISTDITERKRLEVEVQEQKQFLDAILNNVDAHIYMKSRDRRFVYSNSKTAKIFHTTPEGLAGRLDSDLMSAELADQFWLLDKAVLETGKKQSGEESFVDAKGKARHYWSVKVPFKQHGNEDVVLGLSTDVTELHVLRQELQRLAFSDPLTGANNRRYLFEDAEREFARAKRYSHSISVMLIDVDYFKQVNDTHGHMAGDMVLCSVVDHIKAVIRDCDVLGRIGGEEFVVLLPNTHLEAAGVLANRLCESFAQVAVTGTWEGTISPTVSIGVASQLPTDMDFHAQLARADKALYRAKVAGRNQVCLAD